MRETRIHRYHVQQDIREECSPSKLSPMPYVAKSPESVFNVLGKERLTTLDVFHNGQEDNFKFDIITGLSNNQIGVTDQEGETEMARQLARPGIPFVVEWAYNVA